MASELTGGNQPRPNASGEPVPALAVEPAAPSAASAPAPPPAPKPRFGGVFSVYRGRFVFVYAVLGVILLASAAGVVIAALSTGVASSTTAWSGWRPAGGGLGAAKQIAAHLAPSYRLPSGKQLVDVIAGPPTVSPDGKTKLPVQYVAVRGAKASEDQIVGVSSSDSVMFSLCGLGPACSIQTGTPSIARGRLVRREILELALYTFKYVSGMKSVIAFIPPQRGKQPQYAVYLQKSELGDLLSRPLASTLRAKTPLPNSIPAREVRAIDAITEARMYSYNLSQTQQGELVLVFQPLSA